MKRLTAGRFAAYFEPRDMWLGVYVAPRAVYVCLLPCLVIRWSRARAAGSPDGYKHAIAGWRVTLYDIGLPVRLRTPCGLRLRLGHSAGSGAPMCPRCQRAVDGIPEPARTLYVFRGLPGSGKTTRALEMLATAAACGYRLARVNRDCLRDQLHPGAYQGERTERAVTVAQRAQVWALLRSGWSVVVDDTNLRTDRLRALRWIAWFARANVQIIDLTGVPLEECIARDAQRPVTYPDGPWDGAQTTEAVIRDMHSRHLAGRLR